MTAENDILQRATQLTDAWNSRDPRRVTALCTEDYEGENVGEARPHRGPAGLAASVASYLKAFPDLYFTVEEMIAQPDPTSNSGSGHGRVVQVWTARGTHRGPLLNIPATGRQVEVRGVSVLTYRERKLFRALYLWDLAGLLRDIGLLPELAHPLEQRITMQPMNQEAGYL